MSTFGVAVLCLCAVILALLGIAVYRAARLPKKTAQ